MKSFRLNSLTKTACSFLTARLFTLLLSKLIDPQLNQGALTYRLSLRDIHTWLTATLLFLQITIYTSTCPAKYWMQFLTKHSSKQLEKTTFSSIRVWYWGIIAVYRWPDRFFLISLTRSWALSLKTTFLKPLLWWTLCFKLAHRNMGNWYQQTLFWVKPEETNPY